MAFAVLPWWFKDTKDAHFLVCFVIVRSHPLTRVEREREKVDRRATQHENSLFENIPSNFCKDFVVEETINIPNIDVFLLSFTSLSLLHTQALLSGQLVPHSINIVTKKKKTEEQSYRFYGNWKRPEKEESRWNRQAAAKLDFQFCQFGPISGSEIGERSEDQQETENGEAYR